MTGADCRLQTARTPALVSSALLSITISGHNFGHNFLLQILWGKIIAGLNLFRYCQSSTSILDFTHWPQQDKQSPLLFPLLVCPFLCSDSVHGMWKYKQFFVCFCSYDWVVFLLHNTHHQLQVFQILISKKQRGYKIFCHVWRSSYFSHY